MAEVNLTGPHFFGEHYVQPVPVGDAVRRLAAAREADIVIGAHGAALAWASFGAKATRKSSDRD